MDHKRYPLLTVYTGKYEPGHYNWSPFVNKLEARLRFAGVSYNVQAGSMVEAPRGKIPYIREFHDGHEENSPPADATRLLGDSTLIIRHLTTKEVLPELHLRLSGVQRAQDLSFRTLFEEKMYFLQVWERWIVNANFYQMRDQGPLSAIPYPIRFLVGIYAYRKTRRTLDGQGTAKYSADEIDSFCTEGYSAINDLLVANRDVKKRSSVTKDKEPFWMLGGSDPTELDATLYGFLSSVLISTANPKTQAAVRTHATIMDYAERIHEKYFPDYKKWENSS